ncbi:MAG: hypothetical protein AB7P08_06190 [Burkholderiales bacterium]
MSTQESTSADIPGQTYDKFIAQLKADEMPAEVVDQLKKLLSSDAPITDASLRAALFLESK